MRLCQVHPPVHFSLVSIHASVKDATNSHTLLFFFNYVSIHASVKDATRYIEKLKRAIYCFNPRICKRCDLLFQTFYILFIGFNPRICKRCDILAFIPVPLSDVSIHASVKDATFPQIHVTYDKRFQSTHL